MVVLAAAAMLAAPSAISAPGGISGNSVAQGCTCHALTPSDSVEVSLSGVPESYNYSESYNLTISFSGGPTSPSNINANEVGHTEAGNDQTEWAVVWTAPDSDRNVNFVLLVNSVNGNEGSSEGGSTGDQWNRLALSITGPVMVLEAADPFVVLGVLIIVSSTLLAITLAYVFYRKDPDSFDWDNFAPWLAEWMTSTDHKRIGTLYFLAGLFFLGVGGIMAMIIRIQLAVPGNGTTSSSPYTGRR